jgi:hypothetical protein
MFDFREKASGVVHRTINFQPIALSYHKVIVSVSGRGMHATRARAFAGAFFIARFLYVEFGFRVRFAAQSNVLAEHHERRTIKPCVATLQTVKPRAGKTRENIRRDQFIVRIALAYAALCRNRFN